MDRMMHSLTPWIRAARPKTLPAAAVPVIIGGALAQAGGVFNAAPWLICLVFALLIQIGTNYANDYYDFVHGADDERRIGPPRAVASGWVTPRAMGFATAAVFAAAFLIGSLLVAWGGWWLVIVGILSILCGVAYTGGPYPLGYNGWGDVFVFIFFGWVATGFTYHVQAGGFTVQLASGGGALWTWLAGVVPGALATNLLVVNNVRDAPLDREAGKRTLAVRFGRLFGVRQYAVLNLAALAAALAFALGAGMRWCALAMLAAPLMIRTTRLLLRATDRDAYEAALVRTALLLLLCGGLFAAGLVAG
jgi:1,4-dihydroxy-2-naphthoate octaprenyltransferase